MKTIKITQQDIDKNPLLKKIGATAGMEMQYEFVTSGKSSGNESTNTEGEGDEGDGEGGGNHPKKGGGN